MSNKHSQDNSNAHNFPPVSPFAAASTASFLQHHMSRSSCCSFGSTKMLWIGLTVSINLVILFAWCLNALITPGMWFANKIKACENILQQATCGAASSIPSSSSLDWYWPMIHCHAFSKAFPRTWRWSMSVESNSAWISTPSLNFAFKGKWNDVSAPQVSFKRSWASLKQIVMS